MSPRNGLDLHTVLQAAAAEMADSLGLDEITLASLAKKLDIKSPSLYNHVNGLPGLRKKLAVYGLELLLDVMTRAAVGRSGAAAVHAISEAYISFARAHPGLYDAKLRAPDAAEQRSKRLEEKSQISPYAYCTLTTYKATLPFMLCGDYAAFCTALLHSNSGAALGCRLISMSASAC